METAKEGISITIDRELKAILDEESKNLGYSLSKYIELLLRERNLEAVIKKMADSIGVGL